MHLSALASLPGGGSIEALVVFSAVMPRLFFIGAQIDLVGWLSRCGGYSRNLRLPGTTTAVQAREDVAAQVRTAEQSGASTNELEQIVGRAGPPSYSEEELVTNENEINHRESLKEKLRAGIADPDEELKVKAALVYPSSWPDEQKLEAARTAQANGNLDSCYVLTGLANRRQFTSDLETSFPMPKGQKLALMLLDLDDFKPVNDTLGHGAGDTVLKMTAERIQAVLRRRPLVVFLEQQTTPSNKT
ncbi:UNVERIFIED_ORG: putative signal transduction protein with EAL and GGDEF domain [Rhizobium esperanzae]|uniref:GGDEF domain-containing protein n=1 Tax=Rhizobium etli (strain CIAT 652) TaxID=491916 RepID=B3Q427_RHIE6|nr:hypothetical protein RHECIAT_PC0000757 [Rhizobium etli CIAT 652]EGE61330.1 hypothetical protein RHECNPAF_122100158 [Rhizobium etli CNPAF512]MDH6645804.1 putative signal transduction protein with EAL and GGDEF domain [Rhizobium esperanzae]